jgi:hypothetical protein
VRFASSDVRAQGEGGENGTRTAQELEQTKGVVSPAIQNVRQDTFRKR